MKNLKKRGPSPIVLYNQYDHPAPEATRLFSAYAQKYFLTSSGGGQSLKTVATGSDVATYKFVPQ